MRLRALQRGMQNYIVTGEAATMEREVKPSHALTPIERLDVYRDMYEARLIEALKVDYPALARHLGPQFDELAALYIRECPSRTYTLNRFGDALPAFLERIDGLPRPAYIRDLARYELAVTQVFDEAESVGKPAIEINADTRLTPIPAFRLLALWHPAHAGEARRERTYLAIYRRDYTVKPMPLTRQAYLILESLSGGAALGDALGRVKATKKQIHDWFKTFAAEGLLIARPQAD